jgi:hypothetical protein
MVEKLFVLGCPGSGKSTISDYIAMLAHDRGWSAHPINDYDILYEMFQADAKGKHFRPTTHGGFDVIHPPVYEGADSSHSLNKRWIDSDGVFSPRLP